MTTVQTPSQTIGWITYAVEREHHRATWWGHFLWIAAGALLGGGCAALFAGLLQWPRDLYVAPYAAIMSAFFYGYFRWSGISLWSALRRRWLWGVIGAIIWGALVVNNSILAQPASPRPQGLLLAWELLWLGVVYGIVDGMLLSVIPVLGTWEACTQLGWTARWYGKVGTALLALVISMLVTIVYHVGYPEFRDPGVLQVAGGNGLLTSAYLITTNPIASLGSHVIMHIAAVWHGYTSVMQLPPHL